MVDKKQLEEVYKQNLENDIINAISEMKEIDLRKAFDIYYSSKLAEQISNDSYGIENMDAKYLAEDLIENESELLNEDHWGRGLVAFFVSRVVFMHMNIITIQKKGILSLRTRRLESVQMMIRS